MSNPNEPAAEPDSFADLPLQPTGSGVADLEIAYEQMKLADDNAAVRADGETASSPGDLIDDEAESAGHPS